MRIDRVGATLYRSVELDTQVYVDPTDTYTVVVVAGERYAGVGVAKRAASDPVDPQIGYDLASARALRELAAMTERGAHRASDPIKPGDLWPFSNSQG